MRDLHFGLMVYVMALLMCGVVNAMLDKHTSDRLLESRRTLIKLLENYKLDSYLEDRRDSRDVSQLKIDGKLNIPAFDRVKRDLVKKKRSHSNKKRKTTTTTSTIKPTTQISTTLSNIEQTQNLHKDTVKFELTEGRAAGLEYENYYRSRILKNKKRVKRSDMSESESSVVNLHIVKDATDGTVNISSSDLIKDDNLHMQNNLFEAPRNVIKFELSDAKIGDYNTAFNNNNNSNTNSNQNGNQVKHKRHSNSAMGNINGSDSRKYKLMYPIVVPPRHYMTPKLQAYDELPMGIRKAIDAALTDAKNKNKIISGNEYIKFYYGDKLIKAPVSLLSLKHLKQQEKPQSIWSPLMMKNGPMFNYHNAYVLNPKLLATRQHYYPLKNPFKSNSFKENPTESVTQTVMDQQTKSSRGQIESSKNENKIIENYHMAKLFQPHISQLVNDPQQMPEKPKSQIRLQQIDVSQNNNNVATKSNEKDENPMLLKTNPMQTNHQSGAFSYINVEAPRSEIRPESYADLSSYNYEPLPYYSEGQQQQQKQFKDHTPVMEAITESYDHVYHTVQYQKQKLPPPTSHVSYTNYIPKKHENYEFGYRVTDYKTGNNFGHIQNREKDGITRGEYHILLPDGRVQNVKYHADDNGFHADVSYESIH